MTRLRRLRPLTAAALGVVALAVLAAALAGAAAPADPLAQDVAHRLEAPGARYLLGSDSFGRDVLSRALHALRAALAVAVGGVAAGALAGTALGVVGAWRGGWPDLLAQRAVDVLLGFPPLALAVVVVIAMGPSTWSVAAAVALALLPQAARLARAAALSVRAEGFVAASAVTGAHPARTLLRHVAPHVLAPTLAYATGFAAAALGIEAALGYLGLGAPPPAPTFGAMLAEARPYLETAPWLTLTPAAAVALLAASFASLGEGG